MDEKLQAAFDSSDDDKARRLRSVMEAMPISHFRYVFLNDAYLMRITAICCKCGSVYAEVKSRACTAVRFKSTYPPHNLPKFF